MSACETVAKEREQLFVQGVPEDVSLQRLLAPRRRCIVSKRRNRDTMENEQVKGTQKFKKDPYSSDMSTSPLEDSGLAPMES